MNYKGRNIDPVALWSNYVDFPPGMRADDEEFLDKVQCPNPDHDTLKKHFQINARQPTVHCFAHCGISGSYEHAIAILEGLYEKFKVKEAGDERERKRRTDRARRQAGKLILKHATGTAKLQARARKSGASSAAKVISPDDLQYDRYLPAVAREYLAERGISEKSVAAWELGWDSKNGRIVIPAKDENDHLRFLIKRAVKPNQQPKYLYTTGFPKTSLLFGTCQIDLGMVRSDGLILVEGSFDHITLHQYGLGNSAAILGTGLSEAQRRIISRLRPRKIFLFFDRDTAGIRNIEIASAMLRKYPMYVCRYPKGKDDPASLTKREAYRSIERAISLRQFASNPNVKQARKEFSFG